MTFRIPAATLAATAMLVALSVAPSPASAAKGPRSAVREFKGTVATVKAGGKSFRLRRAGHAALQVRLVRRTKVAKGAKPRKGRKLVISARRDKKGWVARSVRLVPVVADDDSDTADDELSPDDEALGNDEFGDEDESGDEGDDIDLEDALGDVLGDSPDEEE